MTSKNQMKDLEREFMIQVVEEYLQKKIANYYYEETHSPKQIGLNWQR